jgi:hypothetical protein
MAKCDRCNIKTEYVCAMLGRPIIGTERPDRLFMQPNSRKQILKINKYLDIFESSFLAF